MSLPVKHQKVTDIFMVRLGVTVAVFQTTQRQPETNQLGTVVGKKQAAHWASLEMLIELSTAKL